MKYTTKQSKVEEVTLDLEDGCIIKLTKDNVVYLSSDSVYEKHYLLGQTHGVFSHYEVHIELRNGITFNFKTLDEVLIKDIFSLSEV